jgi:hypothetical protein
VTKPGEVPQEFIDIVKSHVNPDGMFVFTKEELIKIIHIIHLNGFEQARQQFLQVLEDVIIPTEG